MIKRFWRKLKLWAMVISLSMALGAFLMSGESDAPFAEWEEDDVEVAAMDIDTIAAKIKAWKKYPTTEEIREYVLDSLKAAGAPQLDMSTQPQYLTVELSPYTLFFWLMVIVGGYSWWIGWYKNRQAKVEERIFYTNRVKDFFEVSMSPNDKTVMTRAEERVRKLREYGNSRPQVHAIIYGADPEFLGEDYEEFFIRAGQKIRKLRGTTLKKKIDNSDEHEAVLGWELKQDLQGDWENVVFH